MGIRTWQWGRVMAQGRGMGSGNYRREGSWPRFLPHGDVDEALAQHCELAESWRLCSSWGGETAPDKRLTRPQEWMP